MNLGKFSSFLLITFLVFYTTSCSNHSNPNVSEEIQEDYGNNPIVTTKYPIVFVASVPLVSSNGPLSAFSNHATSILDSIPGGDLYLRYENGTLRNLTKEAGFGVDSGLLQDQSNSIAVRQPSVSWDGTRILFSMLLGGPKQRFDRVYERRWQLYEASQLGVNEKIKIEKIKVQPNFNNISPIYDSKNNIIFISDRPVDDLFHTYPQLDEYESMPTTTGIWKINRDTNELTLLEHAPSGVFDLSIDSFGRILFTKWDHLKRDQQADADRYNNGKFGSFDFSDESIQAQKKKYKKFSTEGTLLADNRGTLYDIFPEARIERDPTKRKNENLNNMNQFFVWQINQDGSEEETLNHLGRHEIGGIYMPPVFNDDPNLTEKLPELGPQSKMRDTFTGSSGIFQLREDEYNPGMYLGTYALEFSRDTAGRIIEFFMPTFYNPSDVLIKDYTNSSIDHFPETSTSRSRSQTGHYRNPLRLGDQNILVSHTKEFRTNEDESNNAQTIKPRYIFQLKQLMKNPLGQDYVASYPITGGIKKEILWWGDLELPRFYNGYLNEVDAVELKSRNIPSYTSMKIDSIEKAVFNEEDVNIDLFKNWLKNEKLALIVSRNVTLRDSADVSQPFNLKIKGGVENIVKSGKVYEVSKFQIFKAELTRGYEKLVGRRVFAKPIQDPKLQTYYKNFSDDIQKNGITEIELDGSMAAIVPAGRALSWQMTDEQGTPVVRERVWVSFAPGEIRTCASCHGINKTTHNGLKVPQNKPEALRKLLRIWKSENIVK